MGCQKVTKTTLLEGIRDLSREATSDILLPVRIQSADTEQQFRAADIYLMRLPDSAAAQKKAPYIIHQVITGKDMQARGDKPSAEAVLRSIFCVYNNDEQEGALMLLNLIERLRIRLLKQAVVCNQYTLNLESGLEWLIYPDDTAPYYAGEMVSTWKLPAIQREVFI